MTDSITGTKVAPSNFGRTAALMGDQPHLEPFTAMLFSGADQKVLSEFQAETLSDLVSNAYETLQVRQPGEVKINIRDAKPAGGQAYSVLEIVNDNMPFLVDSLVGELNAQGIAADLLLHPTFKVTRDAQGQCQQVTSTGETSWRDGGQESLIVVIVDRIGDERKVKFREDLARVFRSISLAVTDWQAMMIRVEQGVLDLKARPPRVDKELLAETEAFCKWLIDGQFTFLGIREYRLVGDQASGSLVPVEGTGLGVLRDPSVWVLTRAGAELELTPEIRQYMFGPQPLIITKSSILSNVHRRAFMDYVGLKIFDENGVQTGELRLVGLFTSQAYTERPSEIPFLRQRVATVMRESGYAPGSHDGKALQSVLENFPRDELFRIGIPKLLEWSRGILDLDLRPRVRLFARSDRFGRFVSVLLYIPRDRYTSTVRGKIGAFLAEQLDGHVSAFTPYFPEGGVVRVHYIIGCNEGAGQPVFDESTLEREIDEITKNWNDRLVSSITNFENSADLKTKYAHAFDAGYAEANDVTRAMDDIRRIERLADERPSAIDFTPAKGRSDGGRINATVYRFDEPIPLSERVPVLENFGFASIDERSYRLTPWYGAGPRTVAIHDMALRTIDGAAIDLHVHDKRLEAAYIAVRRDEADDDAFNQLVVKASASWRQVAMLRAYAAYLRQIGTPFGLGYIAAALARFPAITAELIQLFDARFDPDRAVSGEDRAQETEAISARIETALGDVPSLDDDRIFRRLRELIMATQRTNFYRGEEGSTPPTIAFKVASREVDAMPEPKPYREIWVYSPRVEGVHLRFGPIARGGLRWSDRGEDFRTEVLGLCKAQQVKNTVIVPEGAKGGFLPKRLPRDGGRDAVVEEGVAAYRLFISSLLEITDNLVDGAIVAPDRVVRHDGDDPYLVVAADKGTATFSDFANEESERKGHWLGDAFASGGSAGYDHKKMGITARGGWECVKRHFREMDVDIQTMPFTAIGVGDMSGDVFGNGMLLSEQTQLLAAFDHRDIFVDPQPDAARSYVERKRLFDGGRTSWKDYDATLISPGGGVFSRSAKSIPVSSEMKSLLGLQSDAVTPNELMRAILQLDADLLWFGGIGTYVRASNETNEDADDRANDVIRVTADDVRVKVIGEGANLGITQRARMEFASRGGRINTDFIDNSAGVNSSDMEVNIKIALGGAVSGGRLNQQERNDVLASMTDDVARSCLSNNYQQSMAISLTERNSAATIGYLGRLVGMLEQSAGLDRSLEALPDDGELATRQTSNQGLTRPEISVLLSWAKIALASDLLSGDIGLDEANRSLLFEYFPPAMRERFESEIATHQLRREIVVNRITNDLVNQGGPTMAVRLADISGRDNEDIAYAFLAANAIYEMPKLWAGVDQLDNMIKGHDQLELYGRLQTMIFEQVSRILRHERADNLASYVETQRGYVAKLDADSQLERVLTPKQMRALAERERQISDLGAPVRLAERMARAEYLVHVPVIGQMSASSSMDLSSCASAMFACLEYFRVGELARRTDTIKAADYYDRLAISGALATMENTASSLAEAILRGGPTAGLDVGVWARDNAPGVERAKAMIDRIAEGGELTVSRLSVAAAQVRELMT